MPLVDIILCARMKRFHNLVRLCVGNWMRFMPWLSIGIALQFNRSTLGYDSVKIVTEELGGGELQQQRKRTRKKTKHEKTEGERVWGDWTNKVE